MKYSGEVKVGYYKQFLLRKSSEALEWAAQGGGGIAIPRGVPEPWRCGTEGRGQWAWCDRLLVGLGDLSRPSNLNESMIL